MQKVQGCALSKTRGNKLSTGQVICMLHCNIIIRSFARFAACCMKGGFGQVGRSWQVHGAFQIVEGISPGEKVICPRHGTTKGISACDWRVSGVGNSRIWSHHTLGSATSMRSEQLRPWRTGEFVELKERKMSCSAIWILYQGVRIVTRNGSYNC